jgi:hypothetical protein
VNDNKNKSCLTCFYVETDITRAPCNSCSPRLDKYVPMAAFIDEEPVNDVVDRPKHYMLQEGLEVRDVLKLLVDKIYDQGSPAEALFISDYVQLMQYLMRFMDKNGVEDLKKARYYLDEMIEAYHE